MVPVAGASVPGGTSRRALLRTGLGLTALAAASLGGCGIRLEDDAPSIPLLQRRSIPDEATLIATFQSLRSLSQMAGRIPAATALVVELSGLHRTQAEVVRGILTRGGVPGHVIEAGATSTGTATPGVAVSAPPAATMALLAAAEAEATSPSTLTRLSAVSVANRVVLTSIAAQRAFAAGPLGATVTWPAADPVPPAGAADLLQASRAVGYAFEVIAAQLDADGRSAALTTLRTVRARVADLVTMAGTAAGPDPLGYALPFPVTTPDLARKLATHVLTQLVARGLDPVAGLPAGSSALTTVVRLQAQAQQLASGWGAAMAAFPGMAYP